MKVPGLQIFIVSLGVAVFLIWPVIANPIEPTITFFSIQQNGKPVDDTVNFSMNCYGSYQSWWPNKTKIDNRNIAPEQIFHYSAECFPGDCAIYDAYSSIWMMDIDFCDIEGTYKGKPFILKNFSNTPISGPDCQTIPDTGDDRYVAVSYADHDACYKQFMKNKSNCDHFLVEYWGETISHDITFRQGRKFIKTPTFLQCISNAESDARTCHFRHGKEINNTLILQHPWGIPSRYCELQFSIPSDNQMLQDSSEKIKPVYYLRSPVESLYCSLLSIFGAKC